VTPTNGTPWVCNDQHVLTLVSSDTDAIADIPVQEFASYAPWQQQRLEQFSVDAASLATPRADASYVIKTRAPITVEPIGIGDFAGFTLDGDHRFLLEDFTVTHNSSAVSLMQLALMGVSKPMILQRNKEDDFGVILLRSPLAVFDNTDSYIEWVPDAVCAYTTSGQWVKRKLYSNSEEVVIKPHAFIAVASKNPASFRREDVADRCLIMRLERRASFTAFETLRQDVLAQREALLGEYLWYVNQIIAYMRTHGDVMERNETARMADYARFARAVSAVLGWPVDTVDDLMAAIAHERDTFINEDDPLVQLLEHWVKKNARRPVTVQKLFSDLDALAPMLGATFYKSPRVLAQKVRSPHVERAFKVKVTVREGQKYFEFEPHSALTIVDGGAEPSEGYEPPLLELV